MRIDVNKVIKLLDFTTRTAFFYFMSRNQKRIFRHVLMGCRPNLWVTLHPDRRVRSLIQVLLCCVQNQSPWRRSSSGRSTWRRRGPTPRLTPSSDMYVWPKRRSSLSLFEKRFWRVKKKIWRSFFFSSTRSHCFLLYTDLTSLIPPHI